LEEAQLAKRQHIGRKLLLEPGQKVLDSGCGRGGMALLLAQEYDVEVVGLTLSNDQIKHAKKRVKAAGLETRVTILKEDYSDHDGYFDAIVSVGMFEHVERPQYVLYYDTVAEVLKPDGRALIHMISGNVLPPRDSRTYIQKYLSPGGYIPSLSDI